jgi:YVTN family beta-propeller protein
VVTSDNARLYVSNFGSNSMAVYDIDMGRVIASIPVGTQPDAVALSTSENDLLVLDSHSGDIAVVHRNLKPKPWEKEYYLLTVIPAGMQPNNIVVKSFTLSRPLQK